MKLVGSPWGRPRGLLGRPAEAQHEELGVGMDLAERTVALLDRGGQVAIELERLAARGVWAMSRADADYPARLKARLKAKAPVLFGAGPTDLLQRGGVAVVGSRDVDSAGKAFAVAVGRRCAADGLTVVSGGARGVDRLAMAAATERGGTAVSVLADGLERWLHDPDLRRAIHDGAVTLITPFKPDAGFDIGNAMARNRLIYCLSDEAVVVASSAAKGGTRAGAIENLRHAWVPLFVRAEEGMPEGNRDLIGRGGHPLEPDALNAEGEFGAVLRTRAERNGAGAEQTFGAEPAVAGACSTSERDPRNRQLSPVGDRTATVRAR